MFTILYNANTVFSLKIILVMLKGRGSSSNSISVYHLTHALLNLAKGKILTVCRSQSLHNEWFCYTKSIMYLKYINTSDSITLIYKYIHHMLNTEPYQSARMLVTLDQVWMHFDIFWHVKFSDNFFIFIWKLTNVLNIQFSQHDWQPKIFLIDL